MFLYSYIENIYVLNKFMVESSITLLGKLSSQSVLDVVLSATLDKIIVIVTSLEGHVGQETEMVVET